MGIQANSGSTEERKKGSGRKKCRERKERREGLRDRGTEGQRDRGTEGDSDRDYGTLEQRQGPRIEGGKIKREGGL